MRIIGGMVIALTCAADPGAALAPEKWSCESANRGFPQLLDVEVDAARIVSFAYTSMAPSADGSTEYSCTVSAVHAACCESRNHQREQTVSRHTDGLNA